MNDRGEKIISLAREMLRNEFPVNTPEGSGTKKTHVSFKALYLTVFLTAFTSGALIHTMDEYQRPVNRQERIELDALLFYTARITSIDEEAVRRELMDRFSLPALRNMSVYDYRRAKAYLLAQLQGH